MSRRPKCRSCRISSPRASTASRSRSLMRIRSIGVIKQARDANIPVITFDADAPKSARQAYVGTDNKEMGRELGRQLIKLHPKAGTFVTQSGGPAAENLNERLAGSERGAEGRRLEEVKGSPVLLQRRRRARRPAAHRLLHRQPRRRRDHPGRRLGAVRARRPTRTSSTRIRKETTATSSAGDAGHAAGRVEALKDGYAGVLVGQRPYEMGEKAMDMLLAAQEGREGRPVINYRRPRRRHQGKRRQVPEVSASLAKPLVRTPGGAAFAISCASTRPPRAAAGATPSKAPRPRAVCFWVKAPSYK